MGESDMAGAMRESLLLVLKLGGPLLVAALVVGLLVSLVQAVTQINEATLVFLPKLLVLCGVLVVMGPFMVQTLDSYAHVMMDRVIAIGAGQ